MAWDKTKCAEGILAPDFNDEVREQYVDLEAALTKEMNFATGGTASLQGILKRGSARMFAQAGAPATRIDGSAFASTDLGLIWIDTDNNKIYTLTAITPTWTLISSEIIATLLAAARTFAEAITFDKAAVLSKAPTLTEGIVANNSALQARDAAGTGNADMIKVDANDLPSLPDGAVLAAATEAADGDRTIADKKYVEDLDTADHPSYSGGESHTDGSGLITKMGAVNKSNGQGIAFATPFPGGIVSVQVSLETTDTTSSCNFKDPTANGFTVVHNDGGTGPIHWTAVGY